MSHSICHGIIMLGACATLASTVSLPSAHAKSDNYITHGPTLGGLGSDRIRVWARTAQSGRFAVRYGLAPTALDKISKTVNTHLSHDNTGWVEITELKPETRYYYRVVLPGITDQTARNGSFRTLPDSHQYRDQQLNPKGLFNFQFEYACGNNQNPGQSAGPALPAFQTMNRDLKDRIFFSILNGDWLYESQRMYQPTEWLSQVKESQESLPGILKIAPTLVGVWQNYKHFLDQGEPLRLWHRDMPTFFTYDDHEMLNDIWGAGTPGLRDRRAVFRDIGVRAWYDYLGWSNRLDTRQPIQFGTAKMKSGSDVLSDPNARFTKLDLSQATNLHVHWGEPTAGVNDNRLDETGGIPNAGVYRIEKILNDHQLKVWPSARDTDTVSYSIGRRSYFKMSISNCDFFVCDTRGQRDMHDKQNPDKKGISMLGIPQRKWLIDSMTASNADFLFVVSSVNFMVPHVGGGKVRTDNKDDAWTVFLHEREMLIDFWDHFDKPVLLLTGDLHNSFVCKITDNVWEFASGPHNSNNHRFTDEGDRPANGRFQYGPRPVDIRWSTHYLSDIPRDQLTHQSYCVVQINNVYNNPLQKGNDRWVAYPLPQVIFKYFDGNSGRLLYAESVLARKP
ncbi:MAG: metallophosphoesterase family protein [Planctomycetota bacterium]|nr:metallophosphoesterase family protein [Planctomycetota bacterium]